MNALLLACPLCALRQASPAQAILVAGMIAVPFLVVAIVARSIK